VPFLVDDRPVIALHTATPLWRDLAIGTHGDDVKAVQQELTRLGYPSGTHGVFTHATASAVRRLFAKAGRPQKSGVLPVSQVIWLPATSVVASACPLQLGQRVTTTDKAFSTGGGLTSLKLQLDSVAVTGNRTAVLTGVTPAAVGADGMITDAAFLLAYSRTPLFADYRADPSKGLTVSVQLASAIKVVAVPASALYGLTGTSGCVLADGSPLAVKVVASELGQSLVTAARLPERVQIEPGEAAPSCG
jgi:peptidoglycan hydrolase-like protein with peptidoglycan-binding domain